MFGTKSQPLTVKNVSFNNLKEMSSIVKERGRYQRFNTVEDKLGRMVEEKIELLISMLEGVEEIHIFESGTVADDDLKVDCGVKFDWGQSIFLFQIKSSESGANQHFLKYGEGVQAIINGKKTRFLCPGVVYLSLKQTNLVDLLFRIRDWFPYPNSKIKFDVLKAIAFYDAVMDRTPEGPKVPLKRLETKLSTEQIKTLYQLGVISFTTDSSRNRWVQFLK